MTRLTAAAALAGTVDSALFGAGRTRLARENPGRFAGIVAGTALWGALAASAAADGGAASRRTVGLAAANAAANAALLAVHLRHHLAGPRIWLGAGLAATALAGVAFRR